jgi:uncharacterized protein (TIGR02246 family)
MHRPILMLAICAGAALAAAAEPTKPDDEAAIRRAVDAYVAAFNRGDARALAACWSDEGEYVSPDGMRFKGRAAIQKEFEAYFAESQGRQHVEISHPSIRFLTPDVAVEEGRARVTRPGQAPVKTTYIAIHVKQKGRWRMDSVRETIVPSVPSHYDNLKELEWLIGQWVDRGEDSTIETSCRWTKNQNFITRSFKVSIGDEIDMEGTQVIGWDPAKEQIRSWLFDSKGGFAEGVWTRDGDTWTIRAHYVLNDGQRASSVNVLTRVDENTFQWRSVGREIGGQIQPDIENVTVVRKQSN